MKYIVCEQPGRFVLKEKEIPDFESGNALLTVKRVGICGTDLHAFKGNQPFFNYPRILGHELATVVLEVDENEQGITQGSRVVIIPYVNCERCVACRSGRSNCCERIQVLGVHIDGGMQEVISVPSRLLIKADELTLDEITIVEPLAVGAHALRRANVQKTDVIVVMGCGPIGLGIIQLAKYIGARVIAVDINEHRLQVAKEFFEADLAVRESDDDLAKIRDFTGGNLADYVFDATGSRAAIEGGIKFMNHGGAFMLVGLTKGELSFHHPAIHAKESTIMCCRNATREDFIFVMNAIRKKRFNSSAYITRRAAQEEILTGFPDWANPASAEIKVLTRWSE
ncbi:zinc-binding alcohol dehydrogenase family protein [Chryseolinea soli]|uniref:Zinc-binding alcohol dehydrogenase family protein n=1 Tax=Chryseolinea soli TaxID=2321403 RepID=A0A385SLW3_9BACT|nr:zinc-binding alcohol dehydrogenase family protein [Chryseolinea soli]AYB31954.1 zinc-binding alcohol dehydrogenase family protein [Chryseolinea soli]